MKKVLLLTLAAATTAEALCFTHVLPAKSVVPPLLFGAAMILVLLQIVAASDRTS